MRNMLNNNAQLTSEEQNNGDNSNTSMTSSLSHTDPRSHLVLTSVPLIPSHVDSSETAHTCIFSPIQHIHHRDSGRNGFFPDNEKTFSKYIRGPDQLNMYNIYSFSHVLSLITQQLTKHTEKKQHKVYCCLKCKILPLSCFLLSCILMEVMVKSLETVYSNS